MAPNILFLIIYLNLSMRNKKIFSELILKWYETNKRNLPWRETKDPYKIWVSEIILQQTQISQGIKYYFNFIKKLPNLKALAQSSEKKVLKIWEGLGYYSRAINMLENAKLLIKKNKEFPNKYKELIKLKGIGEYTAAAISSICKNEKKAVLDGNVFRVISRVFNIAEPINRTSGKKKIQQIASKLLPEKKTGDYNQALMDFGSIQCTIKKPKCEVCPVQNMCKSFGLQNINLRPVKIKTKKLKKIRLLNYFIVVFNNQLYIKKRTKNDIWKNLYEPLLIESQKIITKKIFKDSFSQSFKKIILNNFKLSGNISHTLSHQNLEIKFWTVHVLKLEEKKENSLLKIDIESILEYPFPKPILKYLNEYLIT